ncbi:TetR/AcrR family transcriptional regulator [Arthrobacter koreensis]|uniref:TetR/AcrR family transcriptional regulator n=1 Tax=Arthrobacter koreensis TaxID=199136 RepID=UPI002DB6991C|nr:TetR family transcriptional regulator [Arthrobacter koreensis]MEB7506033.1 TetR family transcriptional regulator [Arthrobacter koreensis]
MPDESWNTVGKRDDHKAATRRQIQQATLDLLETAGVEATTVASIAERAGISERTFFRYYDSKESAAVPGQGELLDALLSRELAPSMSPAEIFQELAGACREQFAHEVEQVGFGRISRLLLREPRLLQAVSRQEMHLVNTVSDAVEERARLSRMQAQLVAELIACTWRVAWQCFAREESAGRTSNPAELFEQAVQNLAEISAPAAFGR